MLEEVTPWRTQEFREAKKKAVKEGRMKTFCEGCGSKENVLIPYHLIQWRQYFNERFKELTRIEMNNCEDWISNKCKDLNYKIPNGRIKTFYKKFPDLELKIRLKAKELALEDYYKFDQIKTLCKGCYHVKINYRRDLCLKCKERWFIPHKENVRKLCWKCNYDIEDEKDKFDLEGEEKEFLIQKEIDHLLKQNSEPKFL
jgi:hypothetical protein